MVMLVPVKSEDLADVWISASPMLQKALNKSDGCFDIEDIRKGIEGKDFQLWVWVDVTIKAALVTEIRQFPRKKVCIMFLCGGEDLSEWRDDKTVDVWAKAMGCEDMQIHGRKSWLKVLNGWQERHTTIGRSL